MGDADRPEDVIAGAIPYTDPHQDPKADANVILAALATAGFAVVPQRDVDATARLRAAVDVHRSEVERMGFVNSVDVALWEAAAAVGCDVSDVPLRMRTTIIDASPAAMGMFLRQLGDDIERADGDIVLISVVVYPAEGEAAPTGKWVVQTTVDSTGGV